MKVSDNITIKRRRYQSSPYQSVSYIFTISNGDYTQEYSCTLRKENSLRFYEDDNTSNYFDTLDDAKEYYLNYYTKYDLEELPNE